MKNNINYYYNLFPDKIYNKGDYFYFFINNELYELVIYYRKIEEQDSIYKLNSFFYNSLIHKIITNKNKNIVTIINNIPYILYKVYINKEKEITLEEINYVSNLYNNNEKKDLNWNKLWADKIDYFEYQVNQNGIKYPIIADSFSYFVGLAENAISYLVNNINSVNITLSLSHRKIKASDTIYCLYNPQNIILDHKSRDIAEYIKMSFFKNNKNIFYELDSYFKYNLYSEEDMYILLSRILYPSFYFDLYEDIILGKKKENEILNITNLIDKYEKYLANIFLYLKKYYNLIEIDWLIKKQGINPR